MEQRILIIQVLIFYTIILSFKKNKKVKISSFGTFSRKRKNSRIGRNPKTKEKISALIAKLPEEDRKSILKVKKN